MADGDYTGFPQGDPTNTFGASGGNFSELYGLSLAGFPRWLYNHMPSNPMQWAGNPKLPNVNFQASDLLPIMPTPAETGELPRKYWPPTNTTPGTMQWPDSTNFPTGLPPMPQQSTQWPDSTNLPTGLPPMPQQPGRPGGIGSDANFSIFGPGSSDARGEYYRPGQQPAPSAAPAARPLSARGGAVTPSSVNLGMGAPGINPGNVIQYDVSGTPGATQLPGGAGRAGQNRNPYIAAADFSHLFGGAPQQAAPATAPANRPGPLARTRASPSPTTASLIAQNPALSTADIAARQRGGHVYGYQDVSGLPYNQATSPGVLHPGWWRHLAPQFT